MADAPRKDVLKRGRSKIRVLFYWQTIGVVLCLSTIGCLQTLQSSINIEGGEGVIALTAGYGTSILFGIFFTPTILRILGPNVALVIGDACFLAYCLSNFVPELVVLTVGAVISGVGRSILLPTYTILVLNIAKGCADLAESRDSGYYQNYFQSRFYFMFESITVIGNSISYAILYGFKSTQSTSVETTSPSPEPNVTYFTDDLYQYCGVNDCQDADIVNDSIDQYVPPDKISVYILVTVASCLAISAILVHSLVYPGLGVYSNKLAKVKETALESRAVESECCESAETGVRTLIQFAHYELSYENKGFECDGIKDASDKQPNSNDTAINKPREDLREVDLTMIVDGAADREQINSATVGDTESEDIQQILKATAIFFVKPRAMMLSVSAFRHGMMLGFVFSDMTRAFASCLAGVEMTGLFAVTFGLTAMPSALLYGQLTFRWRRYILFAASSVLELVLFVACYVWDPDPDQLWVVFLIFAGFGVVNGIFRQNIVATYTLHFPKNKNVAFSVFNVFLSVGLGLQYGLSTFMCVKDKIYTQIAIIIVGCILFAIAECLWHRKLRLQESNSAESLEIETRL